MSHLIRLAKQLSTPNKIDIDGILKILLQLPIVHLFLTKWPVQTLQ